ILTIGSRVNESHTKGLRILSGTSNHDPSSLDHTMNISSPSNVTSSEDLDSEYESEGLSSSTEDNETSSDWFPLGISFHRFVCQVYYQDVKFNTCHGLQST